MHIPKEHGPHRVYNSTLAAKGIDRLEVRVCLGTWPPRAVTPTPTHHGGTRTHDPESNEPTILAATNDDRAPRSWLPRPPPPQGTPGKTADQDDADCRPKDQKGQRAEPRRRRRLLQTHTKSNGDPFFLRQIPTQLQRTLRGAQRFLSLPRTGWGDRSPEVIFALIGQGFVG